MYKNELHLSSFFSTVKILLKGGTETRVFLTLTNSGSCVISLAQTLVTQELIFLVVIQMRSIALGSCYCYLKVKLIVIDYNLQIELLFQVLRAQSLGNLIMGNVLR